MKTFNFYLIILLALILQGCALLKADNLFNAKELSSGILKTEKTIVAEDGERRSPSGNTVLHKNLSVIKETNTFKGKKDLVFGTKFIVNHKDDIWIKVDRVWTFPKKIKMPDGRLVGSVKRTEEIKTNSPEWMYYTIESENEIIPGKWKLQYFYNGKEILKKIFIMQ
jgi:hypothetical protein